MKTSQNQEKYTDVERLRRLHYRVIREAMADGPFASLADFVDVVKYRFAALHLRVDIYALHDLLTATVCDVPLEADAALPRRTRPPAPIADTAPRISAQDATAILAKLRGLAGLRAMPSVSVPRDEDHDAARRRAWEMGIEL